MRTCKLLVLLSFYSSVVVPQIRISGTVQDQSTRHTLSKANVYLVVGKQGVVTDDHGRFQLSCSGQQDTLVISLIGYETKRVAIFPAVSGTRTFNLEITRKLLIIDDFEVAADQYRDQVASLKIDAGSVKIDLDQIRRIPYTLFPDINKALQSLPGVMSSNELTNELNVRGGSPDQNLVLLDGVPVYYPYHVFGIASAFNPDMVGEIQFSPGGFSAQYGNRLSSVVSILPHVPRKSLEVSSDISLIAANVTAGGKHKNLSWLFSGRKSYYNYLAGSIGGGVPYDFYDIFVRMSWVPSLRNTVSVMAFTFRDRFGDKNKTRDMLYSNRPGPNNYVWYETTNKQDFSWGNKLLSVAWDHRYSEKLTTHVQVYQSIAQNDFFKEHIAKFPADLSDAYQEAKARVLEQNKLNEIDVINRFKDMSMTGSLLWKISPNSRLDGGLESKTFFTNYGWDYSDLPETAVFDYHDQVKLYFDHAPPEAFTYEKKVGLVSAFSEVFLGESRPLKIRTGIRWNKWSNHDEVSIEPRCGLSYDLNKFTFKGSAGHFSQGIATALEEGLVGFLDLYFPVEDSLKIEASDHFTASVEYNNKAGLLSRAVVTGYYKNNANLIKAIGPSPNFTQSPGRSFGIELFLQGHWISWAWSSSTTISRAFRIMDGINIDTNWDRRYNFNFSASRIFFKKWRFSCMWLLSSGVPFAPDQYSVVYHDANWGTSNNTDIYTIEEGSVPPGRIRYPWYHRLDVSFGKEFHFNTTHMELYFSVRNAYGWRNVLYYNPTELIYSRRPDNTLYYLVKHDFKSFPVLPTIGLRVVL